MMPAAIPTFRRSMNWSKGAVANSRHSPSGAMDARDDAGTAGHHLVSTGVTVTDPIAAAFAPVAMVIGLVAGWLARAGWFRTLPKVVVSGVIITLAVTVVAVPLRTALFGGVTGSGADLFVAWMHSMGQNLVESVAITVIGANLVDKILTAVIVWLLLRQLPIRTTRHFPAMAAVR